MAARVFTQVTSRRQLMELADSLMADLPYSATMFNNLLLHARGWLSTTRFYTLPTQPPSNTLLWQNTNVPSSIAVYCREAEFEQLIVALRETPLLDWQRRLKIYHVPHYLVEPLKMLAQELGSSLVYWEPNYTFTYRPNMDTELLRNKPGFRVCKLVKTGLQHLLERSLFNKTQPLESTWRLSQHLPSIGVFLDSSVIKDSPLDLQHLHYSGNEETPVSWMSPTMYGSIGMLGTDDSYRNLGLGRLVIKVMGRLYASQGFIPNAHVSYDNPPSIATFSKIPGWENTHTAAWMAFEQTNGISEISQDKDPQLL
ncbi:uncharacterized protein [Procambarus clarkii]|uniref:uncharacterized protein n=1 Tax=Procambarus clarkii TaxID=6728 RepID=UPI003742E016